ncbi:MAG: PD-(D/E)XK nuclease family protein [Pseudomonadota bacterium]
MTNAFERHGLDHLSASQINLYANEPALWCMEKLLGHKGHAGAAAIRGMAIEEGVLHGLLHTNDVDACIALAEQSFDHQLGIRPAHDREKQRDAIAGCVTQALEALKDVGEPTFSGDGQQRIEVQLEGVSVPFIGYLDFVYPNERLVVDLKTTLRLPSALSASHHRQGALYALARSDDRVEFLYATPKKHAFLPITDVDFVIAEITAIAQSMERFLSLSNDAQDLTRSLAPNFESFYWSDETMKTHARRVWDIGGQSAEGSDAPEPSQISW